MKIERGIMVFGKTFENKSRRVPAPSALLRSGLDWLATPPPKKGGFQKQ
jgi:hypothetical protein